jgi:uncharacterized membrane protein SpoIIM required for sporulation
MLEQLYTEKWLSNRAAFTFILGFAYAVLGIGSALLIFPTQSALAAVAFTSLLLLPSLNKMLSSETKQAASEKRFDLTDPFKNHIDVFSVYFFIFLGVMLAFSLFSFMLPSIAASELFSSQINVLGLSGSATEVSDSFNSIVSNNLAVFVIILLASFVYGAGSIFVIVWNASVWGVIFATIARDSAIIVGQNPYSYFILTLIAVFPHVFFEAAAYFMAAISGAIVSRATLTEKLFSDRFTKVVESAIVVFFLAVILLFIAGFIEVFVSGKVFNLFNL